MNNELNVKGFSAISENEMMDTNGGFAPIITEIAKDVVVGLILMIIERCTETK